MIDGYRGFDVHKREPPDLDNTIGKHHQHAAQAIEWVGQHNKTLGERASLVLQSPDAPAEAMSVDEQEMMK